MKRWILIIILYLSNNYIFAQLSDVEIKSIDDFVEKATVEESIGQLFMTGLPTDVAQYLHDGVVEELIKEIGIGWIQLNTYNYYWNKKINPTEDDLFSAVKSFYNYIQSFSKGDNINLPIGFAANFEGERISSIRDLITQVPEALTVSISNCNEMAEKAGCLTGHVLKQVGVHLLLGPVLDIDSIPKKEYVTTIQNRSFGGSPVIVANAASQYLAGMKKNGVLAIGKHYPGHGGVLEDSHNSKMPESNISIDNFNNSLYPYRVLQESLDGVMTAHVAVNFLKPSENKIITFSPLFVDKLLRANKEIDFDGIKIEGLAYDDKVAITDDLSDMGTIRKYIKDNNISWLNVLIQAFESGHDMFLFSSIERNSGTSLFSNYGDFTIEQLKNLIINFTQYINSDQENVKRFKISLRRVMMLKAKIAKAKNQNINEFLLGNIDRWVLTIGDKKTLNTIPINSESINSEVLAKSILDTSAVLINKKTNFIINDDNPMSFYSN